MKKLLFFSVFSLLIVASLFCDSSDDFLLGNYSYWQGKDRATAKYATAADSVFRYMVECGYNTTICNAYLYEDTFTGSMLSDMGSAGLKAILTDFGWDGLQTDDYYSTRGLSLSNYQKYEAEYRDGTSITENDGTKDIFYYRSRGDESLRGVAMPGPIGAMSNNAYIECDPSLIDSPRAGYVYDGSIYRWPTNDLANPTDELKKEFQFVKLPYEAPGSGLTAYMLNNTYVYVTVAFQCPDDEEVRLPYYPHDLITLDIIDPNASNPWFERIPFVIEGDNLISYQAIIDDVEYRQLPVGEYNNRLLTVKIPLSTFYSKGMLLEQDSSTYVLSEFNVRVYWQGQTTLYLDYIEIEDSIHKGMRDNPSQFSYKVNSRISDLKNLGPAGVIEFFYGFDEPNQPQFDSYRLVQDMIDSDKPNIVSAVYDWQRKMEKSHNSANPDPLDQFYQHQLAFIEKASPKYFAPDIYPIVPETVWNAEEDDNFVQELLEKNLLSRYNKFKTEQAASVNSYTFYPIVQSFGEWVEDNHWESWLRPPAETQKMLQYLPLCYQADGIINYIFPTFTDGAAGSKGQYGPLLIVDNGGTLSYEPQTNYYALQEANHKILQYHSSISESEWLWAENLIVNQNNPSIDLTSALLDSLYVMQSVGEYQGYIHSGLYNMSGQPRFMLVNKRANYLRPGFNPLTSNNEALDNCFSVPLAQVAHFVPNATAYSLFGTHTSLYDSYQDDIYVQSNGRIDVTIDPGDGVLLQMCSSLPPVVTNDADVKNIAYLSGSITIDQGAVVTIHPGTETRIFAHSTILVKGGSTLSISGTVEIADSVSIIVEDGSDIVFNDAICTWGVNSALYVNDSNLIANNGTVFTGRDASSVWNGMRISNGATVNMDNTTISYAMTNNVQNSNIALFDCRFNVPSGGTGLVVSQNSQNLVTRISSSTSDKGFFGNGVGNTGILHDPNGKLILNGIVFDGLNEGLWRFNESTVRDTILNCSFVNNINGMHLFGIQYSPLIQNCIFSENDLGAYFEAASPEVLDCEFEGCGVGILTELATASTGGIYDSNFSSGDIAIISRGSNQRVAGNKFYTNTGILNHAGSILNMGNSANNLFQAEHENLKFQDTASYNARVQLYTGHNDFYHTNPGPTNPSWDFHFDANWYVNPPPKSNAINASFNWFADNQVKISCPGVSSHYVSYSSLDPAPNVYLENNERMAQAMSAELAGNYLTANDTYKTILNENEISESELLYDALDAYYRTADLAGVTLTGTESYLLAKIAQYETDNPILTKYLQDYLVKNCLQAEAYQTAIDLLELRILNAESPVDSLHAVMNLEIVLQLAAMSENKKPISTKYTQYIYPDRNVFKAKHQEHWDLLDELLNGTEEDMIPIPNKALISSNYPNPFNPSTTIAFSIPKDGLVKVGIYNVKGQKVKDLCDSEMLRGFHKVVWDGKDKHQRDVSSGIYFVKMQASGAISTRKIMLMK